MILIEEIKMDSFRNLKHVKIKNIRDLNILIGPNNCGKTNVLELINHFSMLNCRDGYKYHCEKCHSAKAEGVYLSIPNEDDIFLKREKEVKISLSLNREAIEKLVPGVLNKQEKNSEQICCSDIKAEIALENEEGDIFSLYAKHFSVFIHRDILEEIKNILYCPEGRLQTYKNKDFPEYIREKKFSGAEMRRLIHFIANTVDPKIRDYRYEDLIREIDGEDLTVTIEEQGSGLRSLICLAADILSTKDARIILIDEPELGLNPFAKQEFLKFLLELAENRQIFIATQDPTFVNPSLWKKDRVSVYFYSLTKEDFVRIDLNQNKQNPKVFAGYLPHTTSLKDVHIYVEGSSDVYIFQILLRKFLQNVFKENWFEIENKIGIFHLCGDFWEHLLYTIPKLPYRCIVILDNDKRKSAEEVVKKHNESSINTSKFKVCELDEVREVFEKGEYHPLYCLKENCIEGYLNFDCANLPENYKKTRDGPKAAEELKELPPELEKIFKIILSGENEP